MVFKATAKDITKDSALEPVKPNTIENMTINSNKLERSISNSRKELGIADLFSAPPDNYTIQLTAMRELESVLDYSASPTIDDPIHSQIFNTGGITFVLGSGILKNEVSALKFQAKLAQDTELTLEPWIIKLGSLQNAIRPA